jgi:hypothetical protein
MMSYSLLQKEMLHNMLNEQQSKLTKQPHPASGVSDTVTAVR